MDMKKARDQARKENKVNKKNAKGKAKATKETTPVAGSAMTSVHDAFAKKTPDAKIVVASPVPAGKADGKRDMKRRG